MADDRDLNDIEDTLSFAALTFAILIFVGGFVVGAATCYYFFGGMME
uniref:Uncharacterized protein n=1 Tax=viral metagenome TaxID=1070528 RepID=A0A6M3K1E0_9ZZZZ